MILERNMVLELKREGYSNREILAICQDETVKLNKKMVKKELASPDNKTI